MIKEDIKMMEDQLEYLYEDKEKIESEIAKLEKQLEELKEREELYGDNNR